VNILETLLDFFASHSLRSIPLMSMLEQYSSFVFAAAFVLSTSTHVPAGTHFKGVLA